MSRGGAVWGDAGIARSLCCAASMANSCVMLWREGHEVVKCRSGSDAEVPPHSHDKMSGTEMRIKEILKP